MSDFEVSCFYGKQVENSSSESSSEENRGSVRYNTISKKSLMQIDDEPSQD